MALCRNGGGGFDGRKFTIISLAANRGGRRFMEKMASESKGARFRQWFGRYGLLTIFVPALIPIPMPLKLFVVSAGVLGTSPVSFVLVILVARILRYAGEAWLGVPGKQSTASPNRARMGVRGGRGSAVCRTVCVCQPCARGE